MIKARDFGTHLYYIGWFANVLITPILKIIVILHFTSTTCQDLENTLPWKISWVEEGRLQSMGS